MVAGFCNAVIGFIIMRFSADPVAAVLPAAGLIGDDQPVTASTAILLCVRNELPLRIIRNLEPMLEGIHASGYGERFHLYLLSDTSDADLAVREEALFSELIASWRDRIAISYRRRTVNVGFKAGNIREFCERWGSRHEFAVTLDADSFMSADAIIRLVRIMQVDPRLGILQGLIVGLPSTSLFARIFQFGMRLGMRSYTIGSAWWQSDCGPYWGHNAVLRLEPFIKHCQLPLLSGGGEAGAAYPQSRPDRGGADARCRLSRARGAAGRSRLGGESADTAGVHASRPALVSGQYAVLAISVAAEPQAGQPLSAGTRHPDVHRLAGLDRLARPRDDRARTAVTIPPRSCAPMPAGALLTWVLVMWFSPKIAGALDVLLSPEERRAFGGAGRFTVNFVIETMYSIILCPILWISHTIFLFGLLFNREISWMGQVRDDHAVPLTLALRDLWPQTLVGCASLGLVLASQPWALPYIFLLAGGPALSALFATVTAWPALGGLAARMGIGRVPEETVTPEDLLELALPAINSESQPPLTSSV